jgi:lactoylglutathione lyase
MVLGLRTVIYHVPDLKRAKEWYSAAFGIQPYFDEPYYVGFNIRPIRKSRRIDREPAFCGLQ